MSLTPSRVLLAIAAVCFALAALGVAIPIVGLVALGLFFLTLSFLA